MFELKYFIISFLSLALWLLGGFDLLAKSLVALMAIDYVTGLWAGYKKQQLNSNRAYKGIRKKILILTLLCSASILDRVLPSVGIRTLVAIFYCVTEMLSITENVAKLGLPIPPKLQKALEQLRKK
ncbi:holin [Fusobacterium necrophorum subsp. funduliforme]|uniref:phage holin family protein n=1 Tax=Fusobacterium necrophorum TaxID=859 RepID=UPI000786CF49|nr:phage holin family protein [Fusobacterium necrophorum]KYM56248.1 holin [Fusobacterium necrophorum subsp. funduliforme]